MIDKPGTEADPSQVDAVKKRIRQILGELKTLAKSDVEDDQFLGHLLGRTLESTGAAGATIWQVGEEGQVSVVHELGTTSTRAGLDEEQLAIHEKLVRTVVASGRPTLIEPDARDQNSGAIINPMAFLLLLKPLNDPALHRRYVIELYQRPDIAAAARTGYMRYLEEIGEIFASWQARTQLRFQSTQQSQQQRTLNFVREIHGSLDPGAVAYAAANDGRLLSGCDRLSVHGFDGRRCKVLSVSGQDDFDNRSNIVRKQQNLASLVCRTKQPLWLIGQSESLPRATRDLVDDYLNESHSRTLGVVPLFDGKGDVDEDTDIEKKRDPAVPAGALILEWFGQDVSEQQASAEVEVLSDHIGRALSNAQSYRSIFLLPLWRAIGKWKWLIQARTLPKTIAVSVAVLALILFFCFFPHPFDMRVPGVLEPVIKRNVFANTNGIISEVHVDHGQKVKKDQLLLELKNDKLTHQLTVARGQLEVVTQQYISANNNALMARQSKDPEQANIAAAQLANLEERRFSILQQINSLEIQVARLEIKSPIDGIVVSWDPKNQLKERPVGPEDVVLVIADVESGWHMELFIPERKYGHVVNGGDKHKVTFFAATNPNKSYRATITNIEGHAAEHPTHGSSVRAFASFVSDDRPDLYVGAAVTAKIHCGRTSVGYAWFHELFEFVQSRLLF